MPKSRAIQSSNTVDRLWNLVFRLINSDWAGLVLQAWQLLKTISAERMVGLYEVLEFEHALELCDANGKKAT